LAQAWAKTPRAKRVRITGGKAQRPPAPAFTADPEAREGRRGAQRRLLED